MYAGTFCSVGVCWQVGTPIAQRVASIAGDNEMSSVRNDDDQWIDLPLFLELADILGPKPVPRSKHPTPPWPEWKEVKPLSTYSDSLSARNRLAQSPGSLISFISASNLIAWSGLHHGGTESTEFRFVGGLAQLVAKTREAPCAPWLRGEPFYASFFGHRGLGPGFERS